MTTTQAFRNALHIPLADPVSGNVVGVVAPGGDWYPTAWSTAAGLPEAPLDGQQYARQSAAWTTVVSGSGSTGTTEYTFNVNAAEPPGGGQVRLNNATQSSATKLWIHYTTAPGNDAKNMLVYAYKTGKDVYIQDKDDSSRWIIFTLTSDCVDKTTYGEWNVTYKTAGANPLVGQRVLLEAKATGAAIDAYTKAEADAKFVDTAGDTMTGKLSLPAGSTAGAPINLGLGTAPSAPVDGDMWIAGQQVLYRSGSSRVLINDSSTQTMNGPKTFAAKASFVASAAGAASMVLPHGVAPTAPVNGDLWTTTAGLHARINGVTVGPYGVGTVTAVSGTAPVVSSGGTAPAISMAAATASVPGYLTAADWNTFNGKASAAAGLPTGGTAGQVLSKTDSTDYNTQWTTPSAGGGGVSSVTGTAPVVSSGGATPAISMPAATASVSGHLTSTDWNTFNSKATAASVDAAIAATIIDAGTY
jgi:hypothetical protein